MSRLLTLAFCVPSFLHPTCSVLFLHSDSNSHKTYSRFTLLHAAKCKYMQTRTRKRPRTCEDLPQLRNATRGSAKRKAIHSEPLHAPSTHTRIKNTQKNNFSGMRLRAAERGIHCVYKNTTLGRSHTQTDTQFMTDC